MKKQIKVIALTFLILASSNILKAQTTTEEITYEFFTLYENSPEKAYDFLTRDLLLKADTQTIENLKIQFINNVAGEGGYFGNERIGEKNIGNSLKMLTFIIKHEKRPIRVSFIFYKLKDKWELKEFNFDGELINELKESGKMVPNESIKE